MSIDPVAALLAYHSALDRHDLDAVTEMMADDVRYVSVGLGDVRGRDSVMAALATYFATSPDHQAFDDEIRQVSPDMAESRWRLRATNKVTSAVVERRGIETVTFDRLGKISAILVEDLS